MYYSAVLAESYLHRLDPFAVQLTDSIGLRWYGLAYISGFVVAWFVLRWLGKKKISLVLPERAGDFVFAGVIGVLVGGRVGYGLFYDHSMFYTFTSEVPWWEVLAIHRGGLSSHGGIIGVLAALILWARKNNISILNVMDTGAICAVPGLFFGRIANFINGELWGKRLSDDLQINPPFWSVKYPAEITEVWLLDPGAHEAQLSSIETLRTVVAGGETFHDNLVSMLYAGDEVVTETVQPLLTAWYPSQLFQAMTDGPILFAAMIVVWWNPRKPGVVAGWFLIVYGLLRVITEAYRQPDDGVSAILGLSRGQLLSAAMIVCGIALWLICMKRNAKKLGGIGVALQ